MIRSSVKGFRNRRNGQDQATNNTPNSANLGAGCCNHPGPRNADRPSPSPTDNTRPPPSRHPSRVQHRARLGADPIHSEVNKSGSVKGSGSVASPVIDDANKVRCKLGNVARKALMTTLRPPSISHLVCLLDQTPRDLILAIAEGRGGLPGTLPIEGCKKFLITLRLTSSAQSSPLLPSSLSPFKPRIKAVDARAGNQTAPQNRHEQLNGVTSEQNG